MVSVSPSAVAPAPYRQTTQPRSHNALHRQMIGQLASSPFHLAIGFTAGIVATIFTVIYYQADAITALGDSRARLILSRRLIENAHGFPTFSLEQLGGVWLPIPQLLMTLTAWFDPLYERGLSGTFVSAAAYIATAVVLYELGATLARTIGASVVGQRVAGVGTSLAFILSINILYFAVVPMAEMPLLCVMAFAALCLAKWEEDITREGWFTLLRFALLIGCLIRYEAWFVGAITTALVGIKVFATRRQMSEAVHAMIAAASGIAVAVLLWLGYLWLYFGNPLYFATSEYSAKAIEMLEGQRTFLKYDAIETLRQYTIAISLNFSSFMIAVTIGSALVGVVTLSLKRRFLITPIFLFSLSAAAIVSLYLGQSAVDLRPDTGDYYNVRYGLLFALPVAVMPGVLLGLIAHLFRRFAFLVLAAYLVACAIPLADPIGNTITLKDTAAGHPPGQPELTEWLHEHYQPGAVVLVEKVGDMNTVLFDARLPQRMLITESDDEYWRSALADPSLVDWVLVKNDDLLDRQVASRPAFREQFVLLYETGYGRIYARLDSAEAATGR